MIICEAEKCSGCSLCYNVCPTRCIEMKYDVNGALSPVVDESVCIRCMVCRDSCIANNKISFSPPIKVFAGWSLIKDDRKSSSSGGAASVFSSKMIEKGGYVFGAGFSDHLQLKHYCAGTPEQLKGFKGSKYFQSYIGDAYTLAAKHLHDGKPVLFVGSPCQVWALRCFVGSEDENLVAVDFVCHGVPSQKYIDEYIEYLTPSLPSPPDSISFRVSQHYIFQLFKEGKTVFSNSYEDDIFLNGFLCGVYHRDSCYRCPFAQKNRVSDITIGDFWGLGKNVAFQHDQADGVSLIMANTPKGLSYIESCADRLFLEQRSVEEAVQGNSQLSGPVPVSKARVAFKNNYRKKGFVRSAQCYLNRKKRANAMSDRISAVKRFIKRCMFMDKIKLL